MNIIKTTDFRTDEPFTIYECEYCGIRRTDKKLIERCEINCHHREEAVAGLL